MGISTSFSADVDVDLSNAEIAEEISESDLREIVALKLGAGHSLPNHAEFGGGLTSDKGRFVEDAHREALRLGSELPQVFRDLLFYVHGRPIS